MKITVIMTGQEHHRLAERADQLIRARATNPTPPSEDDPPSSDAPARRQSRRRRDRRS